MIWEEDHMARHVYLTDQHSPDVKPSWFGESIGHYENGDTLVVDTIGLNARTFVDSFRTPHTEQLHVVERFRIVDGGKALEVDCACRGSGRVHHAVERHAALPARRARPAARAGLRREQCQVFQLRRRPDPAGRQAGFLSGRPGIGRAAKAAPPGGAVADFRRMPV